MAWQLCQQEESGSIIDHQVNCNVVGKKVMQSCTTMLKTLLQIIENNSFIVLYPGLNGHLIWKWIWQNCRRFKESYKYLSVKEMKGFRNQALWRYHKGPMEAVYKYPKCHVQEGQKLLRWNWMKNKGQSAEYLINFLIGRVVQWCVPLYRTIVDSLFLEDFKRGWCHLLTVI